MESKATFAGLKATQPIMMLISHTPAVPEIFVDFEWSDLPIPHKSSSRMATPKYAT